MTVMHACASPAPGRTMTTARPARSSLDAIATCVALTVAGSGCGDGTSPNEPVAAVLISPSIASVEVGTTLQLVATVTNDRGDTLQRGDVTWVSSDIGAVVVSTGGLAEGISAGVTRINATVGGVSGTAQINVPGLLRAFAVFAGATHTCSLRTNGSAYCWGLNGSGELGDSTGEEQLSPVAVSGGLAFSTLAPSESGASSGVGSRTCALTIDGTAYCWGSNNYGALGDGTLSHSSWPVAVATNARFARIGSGGGHSCGVTTGSVGQCWGAASYGQLGGGTFGESASPTTVAGGLLFEQMSGGSYHTCGLTNGGAAHCWGYGFVGLLGDSTVVTDRNTPVPVHGNLTFSQLDAGGFHTCALRANDMAYCWGWNKEGQLGTGALEDGRTPQAVAGGHAFASLTAGGEHTCALKADGTAFCWGQNRSGQLGDGSTTTRTSPVAVGAGLTFAGISAGPAHTCAVSSDGVVHCWGFNLTGALGDGTRQNRAAPTPVRIP